MRRLVEAPSLDGKCSAESDSTAADAGSDDDDLDCDATDCEKQYQVYLSSGKDCCFTNRSAQTN